MTDRPTIAQQITWVYTADLDGTAAYYRDVLGLEQVLDQGACRIFATSADAFIGVCTARPGRWVEPKGVVLTMVAPDPGGVDAWYDWLGARGGATEGPPERHEDFNVYCFFARDPNGYLLEFQSFLDPAWAGGG
ncbi:MAG: VOC family protein [Alphaproteobacteria bacterium]|jgi:catechol 2,3-dioxygenase-like lactoylglutathione lyase family enzyme|nr:VOC family protein [Alphaproteobacteria bacterium]MDP6563272.1 VOC family protein [Alphaproteobacteria bacterium]MDP6812420.1 VOC family protein [Alphaproteobacteria bacterium]